MASGRRSCWKTRSRLAVLTALAIALAAPALAHDYHVSLAEVEYNIERGFLEVALRVLPEDFERALSLDAGSPVVLDGGAATDQRIIGYLRDRVRVRGEDGQALELGWVGEEVDHRAAWLYFEFRVPPVSTDWTFENRILFEIEPRQIHHVLFKRGEERRSWTLSVQDRQPITLPIRAPETVTPNGGS